MSDFYWPGLDDLGVYDLVHDSGAVWREAMWTGEKWVAKGPSGGAIEHLEVISLGYLGVRREAEKPDNAATAQQALDEWRACKQQPKAADWAYKWAVRLCEIAGAR